uniref:Beta-1,4-galactosyltransferase n=1 Tax=Sus scrofa TaxID=9823 RepID=A0A8D1FHC2_PIG
MSNAWGRDMEAIDSPSAVRQRARVGPAAGGGTHLSRTRAGRCRREKTRKRVERTTTPRRLWVCRPTTPRCPCGCFPRLLWSGKRGLQLPAVLTATSLAPPTAPRGLHASPVRFPGALAREQVNSTAFNRGKLRNVGFWEAMQEEDWDCVFFHDVNLLPEDDRNLYICDIFPAHVAVAIDKFNYKLPYRGYLGGVFALRPIHYLRINGFPSTHWGWGREDDDIAARLKLSGMPLLRPHLLFGRYHMLEEGPDPSQEQSPPSPGLQALIRHKWRPNGTDLLDYRLLSKELQPLYTNLTVDISPSVPG